MKILLKNSAGLGDAAAHYAGDASGPAFSALFRAEQVGGSVGEIFRRHGPVKKKASEIVRSPFPIDPILNVDAIYWHISRNVQPTILQLSAPFALRKHLRFGRRW
jgi:hypothetical protein